MRVIELTEKEWELWNRVQANIDSMMNYLSTLTREQRFQWYREHQYCYPVSFEKEIGGTLYSVNAHFSERSDESVEEKTGRVLK